MPAEQANYKRKDTSSEPWKESRVYQNIFRSKIFFEVGFCLGNHLGRQTQGHTCRSIAYLERPVGPTKRSSTLFFNVPLKGLQWE